MAKFAAEVVQIVRIKSLLWQNCDSELTGRQWWRHIWFPSNSAFHCYQRLQQLAVQLPPSATGIPETTLQEEDQAPALLGDQQEGKNNNKVKQLAAEMCSL